MFEATNPKLLPLDRRGYADPPAGNVKVRSFSLPNGVAIQPPWEFANTLVRRHAQVLFKGLREAPDYDQLIEEMACEPDDNGWYSRLNDRAGWRDWNLSRLADSGTVIQGAYFEPTDGIYYSSGGNSVQGALSFLILYDSYERSEEFKAHYTGTPGELVLGSNPDRPGLLRYPAGTATA